MISERLVQQKVKAIQHEKQESAELVQLAATAFEALPEGPHQRILTIKGIGIQTAAALVSKVVSIERFETANHLIGYFGVFPEEVDVSGTDKHGNPKTGSIVRMSPKGNDLVRRLLYLAAQAAVRSNPAIKALFARQRAAGQRVQRGHRSLHGKATSAGVRHLEEGRRLRPKLRTGRQRRASNSSRRNQSERGADDSSQS